MATVQGIHHIQDPKLKTKQESAENAEVNENSLENTIEGESTKGNKNIDNTYLYDVPLNVTAELGRTTITIKELLSLQEGTVIELEKLAGEPLEILINEKLVSRGEVIVINEKFGIRLTDIVSPYENLDLRHRNGQ